DLVPEGSAGRRHGAFRHVRRRIRPVPVRPGALPAHVRRAAECSLPRLRDLRRSLPQRSARGGAVEPGPAAFCVLTLLLGLCPFATLLAAAGNSAVAAWCCLSPGWNRSFPHRLRGKGIVPLPPPTSCF